MNLVPRAIEGDLFALGEIQVTLLDHPMAKPRISTTPAGRRLSEIQREFAGDRACSITCDGQRVLSEDRAGVIPAQSVQIVCVPGGGIGKFFRKILGLAIAVIAAVVAPIIAAPIIGALGLGATAGALVTGAIATGLTIAGTLAINALFPTTTPQLSQDYSTSPTYSIGGGRNQSNPYGPIPSILGTHRASPPYAAAPYTEIIGEDQYLILLFCWAYGPVKLSNPRIGETAIGKFDDVEIEHFYGYATDGTPTLYPKQVIEEALNITLEPNETNIRTTTADTDRIVVDIQAPNGLYRYRKSDGNRVSHTVTVKIEYRQTGTATWQDWITRTIGGDSADPIRRSDSKWISRGQYDVRITRTTAEDNSEDTVSETVMWTAVRSITNEAPVNAPAPLALTAIRIRATAQLSGVVDTFNADVSGLVTSWDSAAGTWKNNQVSRNPADLFRHVLQGPANKKAKANSEIDLETLQDWHDYCAGNGFEFNQYRDFASSVWQTLKDICAAGRAVPTFIDGKWSVVWDDPDAPIVQHFTPANINNFKASRGYSDKVQALRVRFVDEDNSYQQDERLVFADGYNSNNTERYDLIEFPGVTNRDLVWRHGRYHLAQLQLRREVYEFETDLEHLACVRGSRVLLTHDAIMVGLGFGRIKSVDGDQLVLEDAIVIAENTTYGLRIRHDDGTSTTRLIETAGPAETDTIDLVADATVTAPVAGELFAFGEYGSESTVCRVKSIRPSGDFAATLELVDDAPEIHNADTGTIPDFDPNISEPVDLFDYTPTDLTGAEFLEVVDGGLFAGINLSWTKPPAENIAGYYLRYRADSDGSWSRIHVTDAAATVRELSAGTWYFQVKALYSSAVSDWGEVLALDIAGPYRAPADVDDFQVVVSGSNLTLTWAPITDIVFRDFEIRHTSDTDNPTWSAATRLRTEYTANSLTIPYISGSFLIRARSHLNVYSENAAIVIANVTPMTEYNVVEEVSDGGLDGTYDDISFNDVYGGLILNSAIDFFDRTDFFSTTDDNHDDFFRGSARLDSGTFELASNVDLGGTMTVRLSADVMAGGVNVAANLWSRTDFFGGDSYFDNEPSLWSVTAQVRTTDDDPAGAATWSDWQTLVVGDYTTRAFQFRLLLESFSADVSPLLTAATFTVDVTDRIIALEDVVSGVGPAQLVFSPAFYKLKELQITAQDLASGDYWTVTDKSAAGATIQFFDANDNAISRTFDAQALGYGSIST